MESQYNITEPFKIPIYTSKINQKDFNHIKLGALEFIKNNKTKFKKEWACPTLSTIATPVQHNFQSPHLQNFLKLSVENYYKEWGFNPTMDLDIFINSLWVNISPPNSFQETHKHTSFLKTLLFSGVFYIDTEENSGDLTLINPIEDLLIGMLPSNKVLSHLSITPQNGLLVLFPSWMNHMVGINQTSKNRISISWNIEVQIKNKSYA